MEHDKNYKAYSSLMFLREHPSISPDITGDSLADGVWFMMAPCCKNGRSESGKDYISINKGDPGWEKYKDKFDEEYKDCPDEEFQSVDVPYEEVYGEPWAYDHMEYWYEITFFVFDGNPYESDIMEQYNPKNYMRYGGPHGGALSFEDMAIKVADEVKEIYGDWNSYPDFYKQTELKCQDVEDYGMFEAQNGLEVNIRKWKSNDNYVDVNQGLINLRWLKWFIETDYAKKEWAEERLVWKKLVKKIDELEPQKRKDLLKKYEL